MGRSFRFLLALLLPLSLVWGQNDTSPQLKQRPAAPSSTPPGGTERQITLDVQVTDKSGAPVRGLQKQDFTLLDDKQPANILSFQAVDSGAADPPRELVLVVDAVNASLVAVAYERSQLKKFLLQNAGKLEQPASLVIFSDAGTKIQQEPSRDGNALAAEYDQYETGLRTIKRSQGFYGAAERFDMSIKTMTRLMSYEETRPGRKLIIWFSPGWPLLSGPNVQISGNSARQLFNSIVEFSTGLRESRITLYSIDPLGLADAGGGRIWDYMQFVKGASDPRPVLPGNLALQVLVVQSGGRVFNSSNNLTAAIASCASDADSFYVLTFDAPRADHPDEYHTLGVTVDKPGVTARTRTGYYAQP